MTCSNGKTKNYLIAGRLEFRIFTSMAYFHSIDKSAGCHQGGKEQLISWLSRNTPLSFRDFDRALGASLLDSNYAPRVEVKGYGGEQVSADWNRMQRELEINDTYGS